MDIRVGDLMYYPDTITSYKNRVAIVLQVDPGVIVLRFSDGVIYESIRSQFGIHAKVISRM